MKKFLFLFSLIMALGASTVAGEIQPPTFPTCQELTPGGEYYFRDAASGYYMRAESWCYLRTQKTPFLVDSISENNYTLKVLTGSYANQYVYNYLPRLDFTSNYQTSSYYRTSWNFIGDEDVENGYRIQVSPISSYYNESQYVGGNKDDYLYCDKPFEQSIVWQLYDPEEMDRYEARADFYTTITSAQNSYYNTEDYEAIYNNPESTAAELKDASESLKYAMGILGGLAAGWNEDLIPCKVWREGGDIKWSGTSYIQFPDCTGEEALYIQVDMKEPGIFSYQRSIESSYNDLDFVVWLDGEAKEHFTGANRGSYEWYPFSIEIPAGRHIIKLSSRGHYSQIKGLKLLYAPLISVDLLEPGSLGTEALYYAETIKDVHKLKVKGTMNADDWAKIGMMTALYYLDLSEAKTDNVPGDIFKGNKAIKTVILPEGVQTIGDYAFYQSALESIVLPESLKTIGENAFSRTPIKSVTMRDNVETIGRYAFQYSPMLTSMHISDAVKIIPYEMCRYCGALKDIHFPAECLKIESEAFGYNYYLEAPALPDKIKEIGSDAFYYCSRFSPNLPASLETIGSDAFRYTNSSPNQYGTIRKDLVIPSNVNHIGSGAFLGTGYESVEISMSYSDMDHITGSTFLPNSIKTLRLNCPTVVRPNGCIIVADAARAGITLQVPQFLVTSYKLDDYWYNFGRIEGFNSDEISYWVIQHPLVLSAHDRLEGTPSINITAGGSLKINGTAAMPINNFTYNVNVKRSDSDGKYGQIISNCDNVSIEGELRGYFYLNAKTWYFISLPFDTRIDSIVAPDNAQFAIRYYDGANRAENGATGSWKNFGATDTIPTGTGFIINSNVNGWYKFNSLNNESKQYIVSNKVFAKPLAEHPAEAAANRGWNFIGNPYQCFYNIHKLNFSAPITVRNSSNNGYVAYSIIDDDYALRPSEPFFVQCPEGINALTFSLEGRQLTSVVSSQQGKPAYEAQKGRALVDLCVSSEGNECDKTRVVFNGQAAMDYEMARDASKFFSDDAIAAQIYTIGDDGIKYAINERPEHDGIVKIGFMASEDGQYTISMPRCSAESAYLIDNETGMSADLMAGDYTFHSASGTFENRFMLQMSAGSSIVIGNAIEQTIECCDGGISVYGDGQVDVYSTNGMLVARSMGNETISLAAGIYVVKTQSGVSKVVVR